MWIHRKVLGCLLAAMLLAGGAAGAEGPAAPGLAAGPLTVTFFDVGEADMFLLKTANSTVVIDTGKNKAGKELVAYLAQAGISKIDVLLITHFDKDHVGGADTVLSQVEVGQVIEPSYPKASEQYADYRQALTQSKAQLTTLTANHNFTLDGVSYAIDVANQANYGHDEENDFSLVTSVRLGETSILFAGDAENPRLIELLAEGNLAHAVLKVPHHGDEEDMSPAFFQAVGAKYAVITSENDDDDDDDDGPEDALTAEILKALGAEVFLTREGTVTCVLDGKTVTFSQAKK